MIVYHGTNKNFKNFDPKKILSGEGIAKRGHGFNFSDDYEVALHYLKNSTDKQGYIIHASIPEKEDMINLDETASNCCKYSLPELSYLIAEEQDIDLMSYFEDASNHDEVSFSYSDDRANLMFERILADANDNEAWEELHEFSPGYDWKTFKIILSKTTDFEFSDFSTGETLYNHLIHIFDSPEKTSSFFNKHSIYGTYSKETLSNNSGHSYVVFDKDNASIIKKEKIDFARKNKISF